MRAVFPIAEIFSCELTWGCGSLSSVIALPPLSSFSVFSSWFKATGCVPKVSVELGATTPILCFPGSVGELPSVEMTPEVKLESAVPV